MKYLFILSLCKKLLLLQTKESSLISHNFSQVELLIWAEIFLIYTGRSKRKIKLVKKKVIDLFHECKQNYYTSPAWS